MRSVEEIKADMRENNARNCYDDLGVWEEIVARAEREAAVLDIEFMLAQENYDEQCWDCAKHDTCKKLSVRTKMAWRAEGGNP